MLTTVILQQQLQIITSIQTVINPSKIYFDTWLLQLKM